VRCYGKGLVSEHVKLQLEENEFILFYDVAEERFADWLANISFSLLPAGSIRSLVAILRRNCSWTTANLDRELLVPCSTTWLLPLIARL